MGLTDRLKKLVGLRGSGSGSRVLRVAQLPSRVFVDGSVTLQGLEAAGLYGMARVTVHEAELWSLGSDTAASTADAPNAQHPVTQHAAQPVVNSRARFYAVVSLGRQTFASRRVRRSAGPSASPASPPVAGPVARFVWNASAAVVLQKSGATLAQLAIYKAGRVEGALGDKLQCWCQIDLACYFGDENTRESGAQDESSSTGIAAAMAGVNEVSPMPPPVLRTSAPPANSESSGFLHSVNKSDSSGLLHNSAADGEPGADARCDVAAQHAGGTTALQMQQAGTKGSLQDEGVTQARANSRTNNGGEAVLQDVWVPMVDPGDSSHVCGRVRVSVRAASPAGLEQQLWRRLLPLADLNGDGCLTAEEFAALLEAMGTELSQDEVAALFRQADSNGDGMVDSEELAAALTACHTEGDFHRLMRRCPVDGAQLLPNDDLANIIYVTLALDEGTGESLKGGYTTPEQVSRSWLISMTEWATQPLLGSTAALWRGNEYRAGGLRQGAAAAHILVFDRATKRVVEEAVSPALTLAMRALYQTNDGALLLREGTYRKLKQMSERYGARADSPESAADIPKFLQAFRGQINMKDYVEPDPAAYPCFNEFFYRKIKPEARPIAAADDPRVIVSAADCRLIVFNNLSDATRCWIKGRNFSLAGLLGDTSVVPAAGGSTVGLLANSHIAAGASAAGLLDGAPGAANTNPADGTTGGSDMAAEGTAAAGPAYGNAGDIGVADSGTHGSDNATPAAIKAGSGVGNTYEPGRSSLVGESAGGPCLGRQLGHNGRGGGASDSGVANSRGKQSDSVGMDSINKVLDGKPLTAAKFEGGSMAIFRLAPQDYHRFHLPVGGHVLSIRDIPGELLTVNPIAVNSTFADVFTRNKRSVLCLEAPGYGLVAYVAIGATVVGSICWTVDVGQQVPKGAEAGYFAFGGSTIVALFQAGATVWDADLVKNSLISLETRVLMGERLGVQGSSNT